MPVEKIVKYIALLIDTLQVSQRLIIHSPLAEAIPSQELN